jgi:hypothetical protein
MPITATTDLLDHDLGKPRGWASAQRQIGNGDQRLRLWCSCDCPDCAV